MTKSSASLVSVVIVSWNVAESLQRCLTSLKTSGYPNLEIFVIDNASSDNSVKVAQSFGFVKVLTNSTNLGFPKAVNQGIKVSKGEYVLLLNPDAQVTPGFFEQAVEFAREQRDMGVMGPKFVNVDGSTQGSVFPEPSFWDTVREYWLGQSGLTAKYVPQTSKATSVNAISGAAMFIPRTTINRIGMLTEEVFMYYEDLDYCRRVRSAGLKVVFNPQITIIHEHGRSSEKTQGAAQTYHQNAAKWYLGSLKYYAMWFVARSSQIFKKASSNNG